MPKNPFTRGHRRELSKRHKIAVAGVATLGAAAVVFSAVPGNAETTTSEATVSSAPVKYSSEQLKSRQADVSEQLAAKALQSKAAAEAKAAKAHAEAKAKAKAAAAAKKRAAHAAAAKKAAQARKAKAASRAAHRAKLKAAVHKSYANNLDGWIKESLDIMKAKGIPGSYNGLHRNILRESSGNPNAINNWDINAINGIPSKGLLQVIPPTFRAYHVAGTSWNIYDPVANITAAANYAADKYGSMDNVNSAY
ncbi:MULTISPECIES: transglycosylase SLT domain-containing protein [Streptomyces]|uniref:transglycosylase SLT domain-containing protein n=1 Tax=Streptomyces TaxID=1883 RepID=UPI002E25C2DC|nr:transglycosylase SLT domain-containing protein [Streptomyces canus]WSZ30091.1 transglycosylase SLT domain-containing protein [Streptomyces sp. NBC_00882]WSZ56872.1 transglycosylase SLT domain-containing protein [Streptomyces canus]